MDPTQSKEPGPRFTGSIPLMVALGAISFLLYARIWNWGYSLLIVASLFVHEMGHVWALWHYRRKVKGLYAIPLLGAAVITRDRMPDQIASIAVFLMGPLWGYGLAGLMYLGYKMTGIPILAGIASWMALLNLINLFPVSGLDGGQAWKAIVSPFSRPARIALIWMPVAIIGLLALFAGSKILGVVFAAALLMTGAVNLIPVVARREQQKVRDRLARLLGAEDATARGVLTRIVVLLDEIGRGNSQGSLERAFLAGLTKVSYDTRSHLRIGRRILHLTRKRSVDAGSSGGPSAFAKTELADYLRDEVEMRPLPWTRAITAFVVYCVLTFAMLSLILLVREAPGAFDALMELAKRR